MSEDKQNPYGTDTVDDLDALLSDLELDSDDEQSDGLDMFGEDDVSNPDPSQWDALSELEESGIFPDLDNEEDVFGELPDEPAEPDVDEMDDLAAMMEELDEDPETTSSATEEGEEGEEDNPTSRYEDEEDDEFVDAFSDIDPDEEDLDVDEDEAEFDDDTEGAPTEKKGVSVFDMMIYGGMAVLGLIGLIVLYFMFFAPSPAPKSQLDVPPAQIELSDPVPAVGLEEEMPMEQASEGPVVTVKETVVDDEEFTEAPGSKQAEAPEEVEVAATPVSIVDGERPINKKPSQVEVAIDNEALKAVKSQLRKQQVTIDTLVDKLVSAGMAIDTLRQDMDALQKQAKQADVSREKAKAVAKQSQSVSRAATVSAGTSSGVGKLSTRPLSGYVIQSMINGKVWVTYKGERYVAGIGDSVYGAGRVVAIDVDNKTVTTTKGMIK